MEGGRTDGRICELIEAGALAGAYLALARDMPGAERGLMKLWDKWHLRSTALCGELTREPWQAPSRSR